MSKFLGKKSIKFIADQKAKSAFYEYSVHEKEYNIFNEKMSDIIYPSFYLLYRACKQLYCDRSIDNEIYGELYKTYEYFEASSRDGNNKDSTTFSLYACILAFVLENFASSSVLAKKVTIPNEDGLEKLTIHLIRRIFAIDYSFDEINSPYFEVVKDIFNPSIDIDAFTDRFKSVFLSRLDDCDDFIYVYIIYSICFIYYNNNSYLLLPKFTNTELKKWMPYLSGRHAIKMLWQSQKDICKSGILNGKNGIVSLPTGSGKTKSVELIIESGYISGRVQNVLIIAPYNALCNEISFELKKAFKDKNVVKYQDVALQDYTILDYNQKNIIVLTPEKLDYIIHHNRDYLSDFQLFIFDEVHLINDSSRGLSYEFLLTYIKMMRTDDQQMVLISAMADNNDEIKSWAFGDDGVIVQNNSAFKVEKPFGFYNSSKNAIDYYDCSDGLSNKEYTIPNVCERIALSSRKDFFPLIDSKKEIAVYLSKKLSVNDSVLLFVPRVNQIKTILNVSLMLDNDSLNDEQKKIVNYLNMEYGQDSLIYKASLKGFYSHYGTMQNGVKLLIEDSIRKGYASILVSTPTLVEGVNLPIKNCLIEGIYIGPNAMPTEKFRNLIGRAARPDKYTSGSIISLDLVGKSRCSASFYHYKKYYSPNEIIRCVSALSFYMNDKMFDGIPYHNIAMVINNNALLNDKYIRLIESTYKNFEIDKYHYIDVIRNAISYLEIDKQDCLNIDLINKVQEFVKNTFAYSTSGENDREKLSALFILVLNNLLSNKAVVKKVYRSSTVNIDYLETIVTFLINNSLESIEDICETSLNLFITSVLDDETIEPTLLKTIVEQWILGMPIKEIIISIENVIDIFKLDKIIGDLITFKIPIFISTFIEVIKAIYDSDSDSINQVQNYCDELELFAKKIKYGLPTNLAIDIYLNIFMDRLSTMYLFNMLTNKEFNFYSLMPILSADNNRTKVLNNFKSFPKYYVDKIKSALENN